MSKHRRLLADTLLIVETSNTDRPPMSPWCARSFNHHRSHSQCTPAIGSQSTRSIQHDSSSINTNLLDARSIASNTPSSWTMVTRRPLSHRGLPSSPQHHPRRQPTPGAYHNQGFHPTHHQHRSRASRNTHFFERSGWPILSASLQSPVLDAVCGLSRPSRRWENKTSCQTLWRVR